MLEPEHIFSVRPAATTDVAGIVALINTAFQVEKFFIDGDRICEEEVRRLLDCGCFLVSEAARGLSGCVYIETSSRRAYLGLLSVLPSLQREGIGRRLMLAAEQHARNAGCQFMDLRVVNLRMELPAYYSNLGFEASGVEPFPVHVATKLPCHFIVMTKPLT
jgi:predicted N-acetyltransferase YhbS